ncbi:MAG: hypothetical protein ACFHWX_15920 [Bacteroidota bacterium]
MMRHNRLFIITLVAILAMTVLQACYVQKNSESHASVIYDAYPLESSEETQENSNEMVTVEESDANRSLEALSASVLLIDFHNERKNSRWEDNLSYGYNNNTETTPSLLVEERESVKAIMIKN